MPGPTGDIYASPPLGALLAAETRALMPSLLRCAGKHGLWISASTADRPPALPLLACWTTLQLEGDDYTGDVRARADEPLPFVNDAFELILLRHALEASQQPHALLGEALRLLAPGGLLVVTGLHPISAWQPWLWWRGGTRARLPTHWRLGGWLSRGGLQVEQWWRVGAVWPHGGTSSAAAAADRHPLGGGYCLLARKRRQAVTPIRLASRAVRAPVPAGLAPGAHRGHHAGLRR